MGSVAGGICRLRGCVELKILLKVVCLGEIPEGHVPAEKEIVFEASKLILEQTKDLWLVAAGLISIQALIIAHAVHSLKLDVRENVVALVISLSTIALALSVMFGFFAKGAVTKMMIEFAKTSEWKFDSIAEAMSLLQVVCLTVGLLISVIAFLFYSRTLAGVIVKGVKGGKS